MEDKKTKQSDLISGAVDVAEANGLALEIKLIFHDFNKELTQELCVNNKMIDEAFEGGANSVQRAIEAALKAEGGLLAKDLVN